MKRCAQNLETKEAKELVLVCVAIGTAAGDQKDLVQGGAPGDDAEKSILCWKNRRERRYDRILK